ncbi:MAG TPA: methyltransferase domain-containing protein [Candidatus Rubrimentiphilum sp.]|nr:methyltransferase domain-containing protein [Candidatus Rubrimentiphilum sp.]
MRSYTFDNCLAQRTDRYPQAKRELTRRWLVPYACDGMTLINIGCGAGDFNAVAHGMGLKVIACEPDEAPFRVAQQEAPDGCSVYNCDLHGLSERGVKGDFVVMHDVLEHIEDDAGAVDILRGLLDPGGRAIVSVPAMQWLFGRHDEELGHFRRYTKGTLANVLSRRFEIVRMRYYGALSIPLVLVFSKLLRREYPRKAGREGAIGQIYGALCDFEVGVTFPAGTSVMAEAIAR